MNNTILQKTQKRIAELETKKSDDLQKVNSKLAELADSIAEKDKVINEAASALNEADYIAAKAEKERLEISVMLYKERLKQITEKEMVQAAESEKVIADLLQYEKDCEAEFAAAVIEPLKQLKALANQQRYNAAEAEQTIRDWCQRIRPNYISPGTIYADKSNRSPVPVPVHPMGYFGGGLVSRIDDFLTYGDIAKLINED